MSLAKSAIEQKEKFCHGCKEVLSTDKFYKQVKSGSNGERWHYYDSRCRSCRTKEAAKRRRRIKIQAIKYLGGKCVECGYSEDFPEVYDFHHKNPEEKDFDAFKTVKIFEKIKSELDKCILLCANCHRKKHSQWNS